jgi:hypothetical protein
MRPRYPTLRLQWKRKRGNQQVVRLHLHRRPAVPVTEILRLLKRAIAREVFRCLTQTIDVPVVADMRPTRQGKNITLQTVATHFGVWRAHISEIERGVRRDDDLARSYRDWLLAA